ncbi:MAG: trehalose-phosphatase [Actinomycetales bacterium]|nr:trehalose-phosphatase [Actinomycetales bacterium]
MTAADHVLAPGGVPDDDGAPDGALDARLAAALARLAGAPTLLVALDFDGTLAPHIDEPERARALPAAREAALALAALADTRVAFVSGRALDSLLVVAEPTPELLLAGSHGVELRLSPDDEDAVGLDERETAARDALAALLHEVAEATPGSWVEVKPAGFALHTRRLDAETARRAQETARTRADAEIGDLTVRPGKDVLEFSVRDATKGDALVRLREATGADAVLYAGDDRTDEDGFAALGAGDMAIKVGTGESRAAYRVADPAEMTLALQRLLAERRRASAARADA